MHPIAHFVVQFISGLCISEYLIMFNIGQTVCAQQEAGKVGKTRWRRKMGEGETICTRRSVRAEETSPGLT